MAEASATGALCGGVAGEAVRDAAPARPFVKMDAVPSTPEVALVAQTSFGGDAVGQDALLGFWRAAGVDARLATTNFAAPSYFSLFVGYERRSFAGTPQYASSNRDASADCARIGAAYELRPSPDSTVTHGFRLVPHFVFQRVVEAGHHSESNWSFWFDVLYAPSVIVGPSSRVVVELGLGIGEHMTSGANGGGMRVILALGYAWGL